MVVSNVKTLSLNRLVNNSSSLVNFQMDGEPLFSNSHLEPAFVNVELLSQFNFESFRLRFSRCDSMEIEGQKSQSWGFWQASAFFSNSD